MTFHVKSFTEGKNFLAEDRAMMARHGVILHSEAMAYVPEAWKNDFQMALDAQPQLQSLANSAVPAYLTQLVDPTVTRIIFAPTKAAKIMGEQKKGSWTDETALFPVTERTGEVTSYGDYATSGSSGANTNWPQRQSYLFQTRVEYGERELERAGLARINWVSEQNEAAAWSLNQFLNLSYVYGINGLQTYGMLNDPGLTAALTPAAKSYGGTAWVPGGVVKATANEIFTDIQSTWIQLVNQGQGNIDSDAAVTFAASQQTMTALTQTNAFNVNVKALLKDNFPNMKFESIQQFGAVTASNPQGNPAGETFQLILDRVDGMDVGYTAFNEKQRAHKIVVGESSWKQKLTSGTWGDILRLPFGVAQMVGV